MGSVENANLRVSNLTIDFSEKKRNKNVVKNVNLNIERGKITALVGESGSGKTVTSLAIMGILPENGSITGGKIDKNSYRLAMIFQNPYTSLDPLFTVGQQMVEIIRENFHVNKKNAQKEAVSYLESVNLPNPESIMERYPFELSGGMCQRVMIAAAMALKPDFLIADEPTTALDVTVQSQIMKEIYDLSREKNTGVLFITHDLGVVAEIADYVYIMKNGQIMEENTVYDIFENPQHEYTRELISSIL